jgi:hypothetical protein
MQLVLKTHPETLACLDALEIPWHVLETCAAAELYNRLARRGEKVGGLFHSTC